MGEPLYKHLPNALTASRGLAGFLVAAIVVGWHAPFVAYGVYIAAMSTDLVDGWLAKKLDARSDLGLVLDPVSDKVMGTCAWLSLLSVGWAPWWIVVPLLARDVAAMSAWLFYARTRGVKLEPTLTGRLMTTYEAIAIPVFLLHDEWLGMHWMSVGVVLGLVTVGLSAASAVQYATQVRRKLASDRSA